MAGEGWVPIDSSTPTTAERIEPGGAGEIDDPAVGQAGSSSSVEPGPTARPRRSAVLPVLVAVVVVGLVVATVTSGGLTLTRPADPLPGEAADARPATARQAVAIASERLRDAGTFTYRGTVQADQASWGRPGVGLVGDVTVEGEVVLPGLTHEVATHADGRVSDAVTEQVVVWRREASPDGSIEAQAYEAVGEGLRESGAALLPSWLAMSTDRTEDGTDSGGRRRYRATVPGWVFLDPTGGVAYADADMVLTVDADGNPVHVEVTSRPGGPVLALALDIDDIGEPLTVDLPDDRPTSVTGDVTADQVQAAGISDPVEFGVVPEGWILSSIDLLTDSPRPGCATLNLQYQDPSTSTPVTRFVSLRVTSANCRFGEALEERMTFGSFSGSASVGPDGVSGEVTDGLTNISVLTDLPVEDVDTLFESLEPFDPTTQPGSVSGIPSS